MKICTQCNQQVNDNEDFCPRCGSSNLVAAQRTMDNQQRPVQQRPMQQRPPQQRPPQMQGQQRPMQQRPPQQNMQRPPQMSNPGQRSPQMQGQQRPPQMQGQMGQQRPNMNSGSSQRTVLNGNGAPQRATINGQMPQRPVNNLPDDDDFDLGFDNEQDTGRGRGKKVKQPKKDKEPKRPVVPAGSSADDLLNDDVITIKDWILFYIKMIIPIYGIIVFIKTLIGNDRIPRSMTNYVRATLIISLAVIAISVIFTVVLGASLFG